MVRDPTPIEMLFTLMGTGCEEVTRVSGASADTITCRWKDGRIGSVSALRPYGPYGATVFAGKEAFTQQSSSAPYAAMLRDIVKFFETGVAPVTNEETLEMFAFMDAAQKSKENGGKPVKLR